MRHLLLFLAACLLLAADSSSVVLPKPSSNAGRTGTYQVQCGKPGYSYYVCVPSRPADSRAYGLHLFFHGQGGGGPGSGSFGNFQDALLSPFGLIGLNMAYADGDNMKDTAGKVQVALEAVLQVMADYPVAPGRGMVACFSGGGIPCGAWYGVLGNHRGLAWPFSSLALYGANFLQPVQKGPPTGWFIGLGRDEWEMGDPNLGVSQNARFSEALGLLASLGVDQCMRIVDGGHGIHSPEIATAASLYARIDAFICPFLYLPEWSEPPLAGIAAAANAGQLGPAAQALAKIKEGKVPAARLAALRDALDARARTQLALIKDLAGRDLLLATYYAGLASRSLKDHPRAAELKVLAELLTKERPKAVAAEAALMAVGKAWPGLFPGRAALNGKQAPTVDQALKSFGGQSDLGLLMQDVLSLPRAEDKSALKR